MGAFAEALNTDSTFVQTDSGQADVATSADPAAAQASDLLSRRPRARMPALPTPQRSIPVTPCCPLDLEIASAAGLTGAGHWRAHSRYACHRSCRGQGVVEQQKQEETAEAEAT